MTQQQNLDRFRNRWVCDGVIYEIETLDLRGSSIFRPINGDERDDVEMKTKWGFFIQCTGLKDKNGKLIYEGDILKIIPEDCKIFNCNNLSPVLCETFYKIEYEAFTGSLVAVNLSNERHELSLNVNLANVSTIIGNIHTHPELLTAIENGEQIHL